jgi:hypothetical protein
MRFVEWKRSTDGTNKITGSIFGRVKCTWAKNPLRAESAPGPTVLGT